MSSTVKEELDRANPANTPDLLRLAMVGSGLKIMPRIFAGTVGTVTANILTLPTDGKALQILWCYATNAGTAGEVTVAAAETTPAATNCSRTQRGDVEFAAADVVTRAVVLYVPVEGDLVTETIAVAAGGVATLNNGKRGLLLMTATLDATATAPGAKIIDDRATASAAGHASLTAAGNTITFNAADAVAACTADVTYYAEPGTGTQTDGFGDRLEATFTP